MNIFHRFTSWPTTPALKRYRVAKFKQRRQILSRRHLRTLEHVQIGGCTGLSFEWISRHRRRPGERPEARVEFLNSDAAWTVINMFANFFNSAGRDVRAERITRVAPNGCNMQCGSHVDEDDFDTFAATLRHFDAHPGYHIVEIRFNQLMPNHLCALHVGIGGMTFFEPNSGEYSVAVGDRKAFLLALSAQYATYVSPKGKSTELTFRDVSFYHVG